MGLGNAKERLVLPYGESNAFILGWESYEGGLSTEGAAACSFEFQRGYLARAKIEEAKDSFQSDWDTDAIAELSEQMGLWEGKSMSDYFEEKFGIQTLPSELPDDVEYTLICMPRHMAAPDGIDTLCERCSQEIRYRPETMPQGDKPVFVCLTCGMTEIGEAVAQGEEPQLGATAGAKQVAMRKIGN